MPSNWRCASRLLCRTQLRMVWALHSCSRASSPAVCPAPIMSTILRRNSGGYGAWMLAIWTPRSHSPKLSGKTSRFHRPLCIVLCVLTIASARGASIDTLWLLWLHCAGPLKMTVADDDPSWFVRRSVCGSVAVS